jgi:hypothetical protein
MEADDMLEISRVAIAASVLGGVLLAACGTSPEPSTPADPSGSGGMNTGGGDGGHRGGDGGGGNSGSGGNVASGGHTGSGGDSASGGDSGGGGSSATAGAAGTGGAAPPDGPVQRYIYAGSDGSMVTVYDIDNGHRKVKSIGPLPGAGGDLRGMCGNVLLHTLFLLYQTSGGGRVIAMDLLTDKEIWSKDLSPGADRGDVSIDGTRLYVPAGEKFTDPVEFVLDPKTGSQIDQFKITPMAHDTDIGISGKYAYLETKSSPIVSVVDIASDKVIRELTFGDVVGPHAVNGTDTYVVANVFQFFGFEMADVATGKVVARVHAEGVTDPGNPPPAGLRNHAIAWKPDETEVWLGSKYHPDLFVFDMTVMPPKQIRRVTMGGGYHSTHWITFSIDGAYVYPSPEQNSGIPVQIIDSKTYKPVTTMGYSEELMEVDFSGGRVVAVGSEYGIGRKGGAP